MNAPLSLVVTTRNDATRLDEFLACIDPEIEVIVVDRSSTDNTIDIARKYHACVILRNDGASLSDCYQVGTETASNEWVLYLSTEERLSEGAIGVLDGLLTMSPPEVSAWQLSVTYSMPSAPTSERNSTQEPRIVRAEDAIWDDFVRESGLPRVAHEVANVPDELGILIRSQCTSSIAPAIDEMAAQSTEQAGLIVSCSAPNALVTGFRSGVARFLACYNENDASTFAHGCIELFADIMAHAKALETRGWENDLFLPAHDSIANAWDAFFVTLADQELKNVRARVAHAHELGATPRDCAVALEMVTQFWGADADVMCDLACRYFDAGDLDGAFDTAQAGLAINANHAGLLGVMRDIESVASQDVSPASQTDQAARATHEATRPTPSAHDRFHARPDSSAYSRHD